MEMTQNQASHSRKRRTSLRDRVRKISSTGRERNSSDGEKSEGLGIGSMFSALTDPITKAKNWGARKFEEAAEKNKKNKADADRKLTFLMLYMVFLLAYSITAMYGRNNSNIYYMQKNIIDELSGTATLQVDSGNSFTSGYQGNMTVTEVRTVNDIYKWLRTSFHMAVYTNSGFDGDPSYRGSKPTFLLGQNMLLGGIRISQYRTGVKDCLLTTPAGLTEGYR